VSPNPLDNLAPRLQEVWSKVQTQTDWFSASQVKATKAELKQLEDLGLLVSHKPFSHGVVYYHHRKEDSDDAE
jgi:hypothetical protein